MALEEACTSLASSIQKWGKKFTRETNAEMVDLITNIHEIEGNDYSGVSVEKGITYGEEERQRLDVSEAMFSIKVGTRFG
ncbi:hypothetical protein ONS95_003563 [Cadophora gregata]|uniref:uncharacterized protein n=1 Tax=Cadophora gregata TaxID=51156 RepID=UPI0026DB45B6|nr:uncharacterized protein ONS95_003563 [Cadophora gregata]KAK0106840.1 hypothetical protein ONS95_003563 [Cadophora gregata]